jgi:tripartite-type tricarboxylate transporter receptor subunit TctC
MKTGWWLAALAAVFASLSSGAVASESVEKFYAGKQVRILVGAAPGGDYDLAARVLARHIGRHIPGNPSIIVENLPGAGGIRVANFIYNQAPKDGTVFGSISRGLPSQVVLGESEVKADPRRFGWVGASSRPERVCVSSAAGNFKSFDDAFKREVIVGSTAAGQIFSIVPSVINKQLGAKFRIVEGYKGTGEILMALERGEVEGLCYLYSTFKTNYPELLASGKIRVLINLGETPLVDMPDVPSVYKYTTTEEQRQVLRFVISSTSEFGRPYVMPPDVPAERLEAIQKAFAAALKDPALVEEAEKLKLDMIYTSPAGLQKLLDGLYATPPDLLQTIKAQMPGNN